MVQNWPHIINKFFEGDNVRIKMSQTGPFNSQNWQSYSIFKKNWPSPYFLVFFTIVSEYKESPIYRGSAWVGWKQYYQCLARKICNSKVYGCVGHLSTQEKLQGLQLSTGGSKTVSCIRENHKRDTYALPPVLNCSPCNFYCVLRCPTNPYTLELQIFLAKHW